MSTATKTAPALNVVSSNTMFLEKDTKAFIDAVEGAGGPPLYTLTPEQAKEVFENVQKVDVKKLDADIEDRILPVGPTGKVDIRIVRPKGSMEKLPVVLYFHGGGWMLGSKDTHDRLIRELAVGSNSAVVFVHYDRTPDVKYPVPTEQGYAALEYIAKHADDLNLDASRIAIAGDSAGGNMATVIALMSKERKGPKISFQLLYYPVTDNILDNSSYTKYANGPWLTLPAMKWFGKAYLPDGADKDIHVFPLRARVDQLKGMPETLIIVAENDVLRDEGEAYAEKLDAAGVRTTVTRYNGTIHDFVLLNAIAHTPAVRAAVDQGVNALRKAFTK
jgi:acetyl esterase